MENETYELDAFCKNCNFQGKIQIPKGMTLVEIQCPTCKLKMLEKKIPPARLIPHIESYR